MKSRNSIFNVQLFFVLLYIILCVSSVDVIIDDAYITFQYAKNFAEFGKPWYNLDPTFQGNGQTSILWMMMLAILHFFGLKIEIFFLWLNIAFGSFLIIKLVRFLEWNAKINLQNIFNFFLIGFFSLWLFMNSLHGLETVSACLILYFFFKNWQKSNNYFALLLPLVRPEFILFQAFWIFDAKIFSKEFYKRSLITLVALLIYGLYYYIFFDFYILLPFLYKSNFQTYTLQQFIVYCGLLLVFLPVIISLLFKKKFFLLIPLNILLFYYTFNVQSYSSGIFTRYYFPLMAIYLAFPIVSMRFRYFNKLAQVSFKLLMVFAVLRMIDLSMNYIEQKKQIITENVGYYNSYFQLISLMKKSDRVTVNDAGYTAYFGKGTCYDGAGLNDATIMIARKRKDGIAYRNYIKAKKINYVTMGSSMPDHYVARFPAEDFIFESLNLKTQKPYKIFAMDGGFFLFVYHYPNGYNY